MKKVPIAIIVFFAACNIAPVLATSERLGGNKITQEFIKKGVTSCAPKIEQVSNFLIGADSASITTYLSPTAPNKNLVSISAEILSKEGASAYTTSTYAPVGDGCSAVYDAIRWWPKKCEEVAAVEFNTKVEPQLLRQNIKVITVNNYTKVFLLSTDGNSCVSVKKEIVF